MAPDIQDQVLRPARSALRVPLPESSPAFQKILSRCPPCLIALGGPLQRGALGSRQADDGQGVREPRLKVEAPGGRSAGGSALSQSSSVTASQGHACAELTASLM